MATVSYSSLASMFLADIGAPDNKGTNTAVQTWIRRESGGNIIQNNPLNIHYDVALSYGITPDSKWYSQSDGAYVAGFSTPERGMAATANILNRNIHGYKQASDALRANNPEGFLNAIAASDWAAGHYGATVNTVTHTITGGTNSLIAQYHVLLGDPAKGSPGQTPGQTPGTGSANVPAATTPTTLADFLGHDGTLTLADILAIATQIATTQYAKDHNLTVNDLRAYLVDFVGHKYSTIPLNVTDTTRNIDSSGPAGGSPPGGNVDVGLPSIDYAAINSALAYIADPAHWLYIAALLVGVALTGYGIITLVKAYGAPVPMIPTPSV